MVGRGLLIPILYVSRQLGYVPFLADDRRVAMCLIALLNSQSRRSHQFF